MRKRNWFQLMIWLLGIGLLAVLMGISDQPGPPKPWYYQDKAMVLLYHDVRKQVPPGEAGMSTVSSGQLQEHIQMLLDKGFHIIKMEEFVSFMLHGKRIPPNAVVLTFDDGYESFYHEAAPVLQRFGVTASNFIVGASSDLYHPDALPHMSWEQMRSLKARGMGFYSHTYHLHRMGSSGADGSLKPALANALRLGQTGTLESEEQYRTRIVSDMTFMEKRLRQELGGEHQPSLLAFPYGAYSDAVLEAGGQAGIELFFTIEEGLNESGSRIVKRINAGEPYITAEALWDHLQTFFTTN